MTPEDPTAAGFPTDSLVRAVAAAPDLYVAEPTLRPGVLVDGLFEIRRELGRGGMGAVYEAYDRDLDRVVALKLHRGATDGRHLDRMRREARAMARVVHPNVLAVHRVGTHERSLYIAMEYASRGTVREWAQTQPRTTSEIVDVFVQAARGLHAAHRAGLVHRDFKPDNVLLDDEGRAKVADFGLANPATTTGEGSDSASAPGATLSRPFVGTPAYMAPEQLAGDALDGRTDQFALCVAMYEVLYGVRPFELQPLSSLALRIAERTLRPLPSPLPRPVSSAIRAVVLRGLSPLPRDRFPDMEALARALQHAAHRPRRRGLVLLAGAALATAGIVHAAANATDDACADPTAELTGVWDDERRTALMRATDGDPAAQAAARTLAVEVDRYADAWSAQWRRACSARQSGEGLARHRCVARSRRQLDHFLRAAELGGAPALIRAPEEIATLLPPADCAGWSTAPRTADHDELEESLSQLAVRRTLGGTEGVVDELRLLLERARGLGDAALIGRTEHQLGLALGSIGSEQESLALHRAAVTDALSSGDDVLTGAAMGALLAELGSQGSIDEGRLLRELLRGVVTRIEDECAAASIVGNEAVFAFFALEHDDAIARARDAVDRHAACGRPDGPSTLHARRNLVRFLRQARRVQRAGEEARVVLEGTARTFGPDSAQAAAAHAALASICGETGELECAREHIGSAEAILDALPATWEGDASVWQDLNLANKAVGAHDRALLWAQRTAERTAEEGPPIAAGTALGNVAVTLADLGRYREALTYAERSRDAFEAAVGSEHMLLVYADTLLGSLHRHLGDLERSRTLLMAARARGQAVISEDNGGDVNTMVELGETLLALGDRSGAASQARSALAKLERAGVRVATQAEARFLLARALGPEDPEARRLARLARDAYDGLEDAQHGALKRVEAWLATTEHDD